MMSRCQAYNKNDNKCRAPLKNNVLFCCQAHEPINKEIIESCFLCMEKIENGNEIIYFRCKHAFHKPCYQEWLLESTYETPICLICRNVVLNNNNIEEEKQKNKKKVIKKKDNIDILKKLEEIFKIIHNKTS